MTTVGSVADLIDEVRLVREEWGSDTRPWFRGEPEQTSHPLKPKVFRAQHDENELLQRFRMQAPSLGVLNPPPRKHTDEWLFLAQHFGLPTRLLDWTEGLLFALHFSLYHSRQARYGSAIWMLNPIELNRLSFDHLDKLRDRLLLPLSDDTVVRDAIGFDLPWFSKELDQGAWMRIYEDYQRKRGSIDDESNFLSRLRSPSFLPNLANMNVRAAWEPRFVGTELPIAVLPSYVHQRMTVQRSRFTIHGRIKSALKERLGRTVLVRFVLDKNRTKDLKEELDVLGVSHSMVYPDLQGLSRELAERF
ncbi:MAG: FRG domain-containing protein [Chloroflexi bacterium]|nr:FRG domain-containing protein [Chloroflexota bacterium]